MTKRLAKRNSVDLRNNHIIIDLNNGFSKVVPINLSKTHTYISGEHAAEFLKEVYSKPTEAAKQRNKQAQALLHKLQR